MRPVSTALVRQQPGQRQRQRALARAALADDREPLAREDVEIDDRRARPFGFRPRDRRRDSAGEAGQQRAHARALRLASASASPSENR